MGRMYHWVKLCVMTNTRERDNKRVSCQVFYRVIDVMLETHHSQNKSSHIYESLQGFRQHAQIEVCRQNNDSSRDNN